MAGILQNQEVMGPGRLIRKQLLEKGNVEGSEGEEENGSTGEEQGRITG